MTIKAITKVDICEDIKKGDKVEILSEYDYMFNERIKDYFDVKPGEVVIKKIGQGDNKAKRKEISLIKCYRKDLDIY